MEFISKDCKYLDFFDDIKLLESDETYNRLAIVFEGKDDRVYIFDSTPYKDYIPFDYIDDIENESVKIDEKNNKNEIDLKVDNTISTDMTSNNINNIENQVKIKYKLLRDNLENENKNSNKNKTFLNFCEPIEIQNNEQSCIIFGNPISNNIQKNLEKNKEKINYNDYQDIHCNNIFEICSNEKNISYISKIPKKPKLICSIFKKKVKNDCISVINSSLILPLLKINWLDLNNNNNEYLAKMLLLVSFEGIINIAKLTNVNSLDETIIDFNKIREQPISNYKEIWAIKGYTKTPTSIKDYNVIYYEGKNFCKLFTLHCDNSIYSWFIINNNENDVKISGILCITFNHDFLIESFLIDKKEEFLYTFNFDGIEIYKLHKMPPYTKVYKHEYEKNKKKLVFQSNNANNHNITIKDASCNKSNSCKLQDEESLDFNIDIYADETKYFLSIQNPCFLLFERIILIETYNFNTKKYELYSLNCDMLWSVIKDQDYFYKCINNKDETLLNKIYESYNNFSFCPSVNAYIDNKTINCEHFNNINIIDQTIQISRNFYQSINQFIVLQNNSESFFMKFSFDHKYNGYIVKDEDEHIIKFVNNKEENYKFKTYLKWIGNNVLLYYSHKYFLKLLKFCNEFEYLGIPLNIEATEKLLLL